MKRFVYMIYVIKKIEDIIYVNYVGNLFWFVWEFCIEFIFRSILNNNNNNKRVLDLELCDIF